MSRALFFVYGLLTYLFFLATVLYSVAFVGNIAVAKTIDVPAQGGLATAVAVDVALIALFGIQHSVMARAAFKRVWTRVVPEPIERSSYVLASSLSLALLFWQWRPIDAIVWDVEAPALRAILWALFFGGWGVGVVATFMIDHFDLFGLRHVALHFVGKPYTAPPFRVRGFYRLVRHPLLVGFLLAFWATPRMTAGHLLFTAGMTVYIAIGMRFEERDLDRALGDDYRAYRARVRALLPWPK
jgi:protein-S-isoprenylcysteine O-methyltransferase Ste14